MCSLGVFGAAKTNQSFCVLTRFFFGPPPHQRSRIRAHTHTHIHTHMHTDSLQTQAKSLPPSFCRLVLTSNWGVHMAPQGGFGIGVEVRV